MPSTAPSAMTSTRRHWLLALAGLGLAASSASAFVHARLLADPTYTSFCDVNTTFSCTQSYLSQYGSVAGVPVAVLGALWFAGVGLLVLSRGALFGVARDHVPAYVFALATLALAVVLYLAYATFFVLKTVCLLCLATYVAVVGIFVISGAATTFPMTSLPSRALRDLRTLAASPVAVVGWLMFLGGAAAAVAAFPRDTAPVGSSGDATAPLPAVTAEQATELERWFDSEPRLVVPVDGEGASVVVVKFNDYQCPPCRMTWENYRTIFRKYEQEAPGRVAVVMKDFPLDPECNVNAPNGQHLAGCEAAVAVRLAREQGKADEMEAWLFANQPQLSPALVRQGVREVAGITDFDARYAAELDGVRSDIALGGLLGVQSTPTFFINGVRIRGGLKTEYMDAVIAYELKKAAR